MGKWLTLDRQLISLLRILEFQVRVEEQWERQRTAKLHCFQACQLGSEPRLASPKLEGFRSAREWCRMGGRESPIFAPPAYLFRKCSISESGNRL